MSIWKEMKVLSSPGKQNSCRHEPERERGAWGRARKPLAIAACDDFMTSVRVSHCQTSRVGGENTEPWEGFYSSQAQGREFGDPRSSTVELPVAAKLPSLPLGLPRCVPPGCVCFLAVCNAGAGVEERCPDDHHHSSAELSGTRRRMGGEPWETEWVPPSEKHVIISESFLILW